MSHTSGSRKRPLGGFETFMWRGHRMGCGVIFAIGDVSTAPPLHPHPLEGPDAPELLRQAALLCARRHPNLRARIVSNETTTITSGEEPLLEVLPFDTFRALCPTVPVVTDRSAVAYVEEMLLSTPIPHAAAPLWQLALVRHQASPPQLVMLAHHSVLDGESVVLCLRELVVTVTALRRQYPDSPAALATLLASCPDPLPFLPSQDELFATLLGGEEGNGWWSRAQFTVKRLSW